MYGVKWPVHFKNGVKMSDCVWMEEETEYFLQVMKEKRLKPLLTANKWKHTKAYIILIKTCPVRFYENYGLYTIWNTNQL